MTITYLKECESKLKQKLEYEINHVSIDKIIDLYKLLHLTDLEEDGCYCIFETVDMVKYMSECIDKNNTSDYFHCIYDADFNKPYHVYTSANSVDSFTADELIKSSIFSDIKDTILTDLINCRFDRTDLLNEIGDCDLYDWYEIYVRTESVLNNSLTHLIPE